MIFESKKVKDLRTQVGDLALNNFELKELLHIERNLNESLKSDLCKKEDLLNDSIDLLYTCMKLIMPLVESNVDTFYKTLKGYDEDGFFYLSHIQTATGISDKDFYGNYYYEDNCGLFEEMNGDTMSEYYNDMYFGSIETLTTIGSYEKCTYSKSYKDTEEYKEYIKSIKAKTILSILTKNPALKNSF